MRQRLTVREFKSLAESAEALERCLVPKAFFCDVVPVSKSETGAAQELQFTLSTADVDRDNDSIDPAGWDLRSFEKAGTVLWAHDYSLPPIARPTRAWVENDKLLATAEFTSADMPHPLGLGFGDTVARMYREGILRAVSVGFRPIEFDVNAERGNGALDFKRQELLEFSAVPVPANPQALMHAKGFDMRPIYDWCEHSLDTGNYHVSRETLEIAHKALRRYAAPPRKRKPMTVIGKLRTMLTPKAAISYGQAHSAGTPKAPEDFEWDLAAEVDAADIEDLKAMSAWVDAESPDDKGSYKLPHHQADENYRLVWGGLAEAMKDLLSGGGGVPEDDRQGVHEHLAAHYAEYEKEAPEFKSYSDEELQKIFEEAEDEDEGEAVAGLDVADLVARLEALEVAVASLLASGDEAAVEEQDDKAALAPAAKGWLLDEEAVLGEVKQLFADLVDQKLRALTGELD